LDRAALSLIVKLAWVHVAPKRLSANIAKKEN
jgi:hypothetical protein